MRPHVTQEHDLLFCDVTHRIVALSAVKNSSVIYFVLHQQRFSFYILRLIITPKGLYSSDTYTTTSNTPEMSSTNAPSQNNQQQEQPKTYKEQLDEAAIDAKASEGNDANQGGLVNTVVEKGEEDKNFLVVINCVG